MEGGGGGSGRRERAELRCRCPCYLPNPKRGSIMNKHDKATGSAVATGKQTEVAVLARGCFWGGEDILPNVPGVIETAVGYTRREQRRDISKELPAQESGRVHLPLYEGLGARD